MKKKFLMQRILNALYKRRTFIRGSFCQWPHSKKRRSHFAGMWPGPLAPQAAYPTRNHFPTVDPEDPIAFETILVFNCLNEFSGVKIFLTELVVFPDWFSHFPVA